MKCILMNKNTKILCAEYDSTLCAFTNIYEVYNITFAPYILNDIYDENNINRKKKKKCLNRWFQGRGIPSWRDKLDLLLHRLNISAPSELLDKSFGLSLSDQYWIKPYNVNVTYDSIQSLLTVELSPIKILNFLSVARLSSILTCNKVLVAGFIVVSHNWSAFISPRPL